MDKVLRLAEDEQVITAWLMGGIPDDADEDDFEFIAVEDDVYFDVCECFHRLVSAYSHLIFGIRPPQDEEE